MRSSKRLRFEVTNLNVTLSVDAIVVNPEAQAHVWVEHQVSDSPTWHILVCVCCAVVEDNNSCALEWRHIHTLASVRGTGLNAEHMQMNRWISWVSNTQCNTAWLEQAVPRWRVSAAMINWRVWLPCCRCANVVACSVSPRLSVSQHLWCYPNRSARSPWSAVSGCQGSRGEIWWLKIKNSPHPFRESSRSRPSNQMLPL